MERRVDLMKFALLFSFTVWISSCENEFNPFVTGLERKSISEILYEGQNEYSYFIQLCEKAEMMDALSSYNPDGNGFTLFLPNDAAFESFFEKSSVYNGFDDLLSDEDYSLSLIKFHILNAGVRTNDFPFGAFIDTTLSGDLLTVAYETGLDSTLFLINNVAPLIKRDVEARNGYINVLGEVLSPVVFTSWEWLQSQTEYSILTEVFNLTNVKDMMGETKEGITGKIVENRYTFLVEPDSIFHKDFIFSVEELIQKVSPDRNDYTSDTNPLYQFAAYHLIEGVFFLDRFEGNKNYNTFGATPIRVASTTQLRINNAPDFHVFDTIFKGLDTTYINFLEPLYDQSNILSKNGAIHLLNHVLFVYKPPQSFSIYSFEEDQLVNEMSKNLGTFTLDQDSPLTLLSWEGPETFVYYKTSSSGEKAHKKDYIQIEGDFTLNYYMPRIFPGSYRVTLNANSSYSGNAIIEVYLDGRKIGGNVNLTTGASSSEVYREVLLGTVEYSEYVSHLVTVKSLLPGRFTWDYIKFTPN